MSVVKKQFTWKFGFQKKLKFNYERGEGELDGAGEDTESSDSVCWDFGESGAAIVKLKSPPEKIYCNLLDLSPEPIYENQRAEDEPVYENTCLEEPLYANCSSPVSEEEPIYEPVSCKSPVNVFLGLVNEEDTISPDPNIYEVPPGAISNCAPFQASDQEEILPPAGFQDYENVEILYSTVVKPKRKKRRPPIFIMLNENNGGMSENTKQDAEPPASSVANKEESKNHDGVAFKAEDDPLDNLQHNKENDKDDAQHINDTSQDAAKRSVDHIENNIDTSATTNNSVQGDIEDKVTSSDVNEVVAEVIKPQENQTENNTGGGNVEQSGNTSNSQDDKTVCSNRHTDVCTDQIETSPVKQEKSVHFSDELIIEPEGHKVNSENALSENHIGEIVVTAPNENVVIELAINTIGSESVCENGILESDENPKEDNYQEEGAVTVLSSEDGVKAGNDSKHEEGSNENEGDSVAINTINEPIDLEALGVVTLTNSDFTVSTKDDEVNVDLTDGNDSSANIQSENSKTDIQSEDSTDVPNQASVIEISEDGTWEMKTVSPEELEEQEQSTSEPEFLCTTADRSAETVKMVYGSQYYINCPVASVKPMKHDSTETVRVKKIEGGKRIISPQIAKIIEDGKLDGVVGTIPTQEVREEHTSDVTAQDATSAKENEEINSGISIQNAKKSESMQDDSFRNIGAQIMKKYEEERQKLRENLPDVSLLDVDASIEDIERERRRIIENQTVRAKRIDSWIKNGKLPEDMPEELQGDPEFVSACQTARAKTIDSWIKNGKLEEEESEEVPTDAELVSGNQNVPTKRIDTWIKTGDVPDDMADGLEAVELVAENVNETKLSAEGEVVYDSIIQNKHKTKSYWEQLMMAAASAEQARVPYNKRDLSSLGSDGDDGKPSSDVSEQEYYDARSQISIHSPAEPLDSLDQTYGPKIVETVAKKLMEAENTKPVKTSGDESVIEREIRLQREREEALAREREEALLRAAAVPQTQNAVPIANTAETKIALELREMREREEELRRLRQKLIKDEPDDGFNSIPNTDEGNYSEYGSEEKELSLDGNSSRMMSPEVPAGPGAFLHQRTQSMDSMSSGHSSGSGSGSGNADVVVGRRRVTVKPLDEPEDDEVPSYMLRNQKETPIEREIRLSREREEELRREKRLPPLNTQTPLTSTKQEVRRINSRNALLANDPRSVQHRLATSRIQQEIDEATEREKELREAGTIQTMSEETVDSKVTRFTDLAEFAIEERDRKLHKSVSTSHIPHSVNDSDITAPPSLNSKPKVQNNVGRHSLARSLSQTPNIPALSPRKYTNTMGQKGLMQRFLATRGKMGSLSSVFVTSTPVSSPVSPIVMHKPVVDLTPDERQDGDERENGDIQRSTLRRGYISAEEKIQVELQEMQKREEELRLQRARMFARSQPNLLCIGTDEEEENEVTERDIENHTPLRSAQSNPNLLDSDTTPNGEAESSLDKSSFKNLRKRNALIAQWENIIQKNTEH